MYISSSLSSNSYQETAVFRPTHGGMEPDGEHPWIVVWEFSGVENDDSDDNPHIKYLKAIPGDILVSIKENEVIDIIEDCFYTCTRIGSMDIWQLMRKPLGLSPSHLSGRLSPQRMSLLRKLKLS